MMEFLEQVARGLCQSAGHDADGKHHVGDGEMENWTFFVQPACAALEAMRNPTQSMIEAARDDVLVADAAGVWRAMINTALSDSCCAGARVSHPQ
jgi:hypothetical protein